MSDDLVKRLRQALPCGDMRCPEMSRAGGCTCGEAADRIEQLEAALREVLDCWDWWQVDTHDRCASVPSEAIREARAALGEKKDER